MKEKDIKHWREVYPTEHLGSHDLIGGKEPILTFSKFEFKKVTAPGGKAQECIVMHFKEKDYQPMVVNRTNAKTIESIYKTPNPNEWVGKAVQIYVDKVRLIGGGQGNGLRIRPYKPKAQPNNAAQQALNEAVERVRLALSLYEGDDKGDYQKDLNDKKKEGKITVEYLNQIIQQLTQ